MPGRQHCQWRFPSTSNIGMPGTALRATDVLQSFCDAPEFFVRRKRVLEELSGPPRHSLRVPQPQMFRVPLLPIFILAMAAIDGVCYRLSLTHPCQAVSLYKGVSPRVGWNSSTLMRISWSCLIWGAPGTKPKNLSARLPARCFRPVCIHEVVLQSYCGGQWRPEPWAKEKKDPIGFRHHVRSDLQLEEREVGHEIHLAKHQRAITKAGSQDGLNR